MKMVGIGDALQVLTFLVQRATEWSRSRQQKIESIFESVVEESFRQLETIHQDYTMRLSDLRNHLISRSMPPRKLIEWWRDCGLAYRSTREQLWTIEEEVRVYRDQAVDPAKDKTSAFAWHLREYVHAILSYLASTRSYADFSFYRAYEQRLDSLLHEIESTETQHLSPEELASLFYGAGYVRQAHEEILRMCDVRLPNRWQAVCGQYRALRRLAGYPTTTAGS